MNHNTRLILTELEYLEKKKQVLEQLLQEASTSSSSGTVADTTQQLITGGHTLVSLSGSSDPVDTHHPRHTQVMKRLIC